MKGSVDMGQCVRPVRGWLQSLQLGSHSESDEFHRLLPLLPFPFGWPFPPLPLVKSAVSLMSLGSSWGRSLDVATGLSFLPFSLRARGSSGCKGVLCLLVCALLCGALSFNFVSKSWLP